MKTILLSTVILLLSLSVALAHGGKKHKKDSVKTADSIAMAKQHVVGDTVHHHDEGMAHDEKKVTADLEDFPSIHPLIVHFAIALIIIAAAIQLVNVFMMKREISWIVTGILFAGVLTAWLASKNFHPHTHGISEHAKLVLEQHDLWADWTINLGIIAFILQALNLFLFSGKRWALAVVALVMASSAYCVAHAGHYGAQLVHIEGIGPQGKFLEMEHHH
ncbi:MAG: hypothetical protein KF846_09155 [Cyclobacteriaceae bacterium]|jgi:uncharacterized membrane protein|nr:hypothetical protein [Cyclobacteriaceae bacterium]